MVLDPMTGKRVSRMKPKEEWKYAEVSHLRIIEEDLWDAVQERLKEQSHAQSAGKSTRQPARPFSGLLKCGCCGGGMSIHDRKGSAIRIRCSTSRESGSCDNGSKYRLEEIETEVFSSLHERLMHPRYIEEYIRAYAEERQNLAATPKHDRAKLERAIAEARMSFDRRLGLFERGILDGADGEAKLMEAKTAVRKAEAELEALDVEEPEVTFDSATPARFAAALQDLMVSMTASDRKPEAKDATPSGRSFLRSWSLRPSPKASRSRCGGA
jgi:hypothetical protein